MTDFRRLVCCAVVLLLALSLCVPGLAAGEAGSVTQELSVSAAGEVSALSAAGPTPAPSESAGSDEAGADMAEAPAPDLSAAGAASDAPADEAPAPAGDGTEIPASDPAENEPSDEPAGDSADTEPAGTDEPEDAPAAMPELIRDRHIRYINGKGNALFEPEAPLSRAEAATILCNLLSTHEAGPRQVSFPDVAGTAWYAEQVELLASYGIINGYPDGYFRPNREVTRAEYVTMLVNLTGVTGSASGFTDIGSSWAREAVGAAVSSGWINGYEEEDGSRTFRPNRSITRAEAVVIMNRVLGRSADADALARGTGILRYLDVPETRWYYAAIMEASIGHEHIFTEVGEFWTDYNVESLGLTEGLHENGGTWFCIDENGQLIPLRAGISRCAGSFVYAAADGYTFTGNLSARGGTCVFSDGSTQELRDGFNMLGTTLFYWDADKGEAAELHYGLNPINGILYWADRDGYNIRNDFGIGLVVLGGKNYLSNGHCGILSASPGPYRFDGYTYYFLDDGTIAVDRTITDNGTVYTLDGMGRRVTRERTAVENCATAQKTSQIILVADHSLTYWEKAGDGSWRLLLDTYCGYGSNGMTPAETRVAGTRTTPIGAFPVTMAFGRGENPGTALPYLKITQNSYWSSQNDSTYNTWVESATPIAGEHLIDHPQYKYAVGIGFNADPPVFGRGTAIFLCCRSADHWYTAGCVSMYESELVTLMKELRDGAYIIIVPDLASVASY